MKLEDIKNGWSITGSDNEWYWDYAHQSVGPYASEEECRSALEDYVSVLT